MSSSANPTPISSSYYHGSLLNVRWDYRTLTKHRRFQANTETKSVLSFHFLGLRAFNTAMRFTL
ncbi:MAG: hypothetical protein CBB67_004705, partial [Alteromonadaceae bacterium TMED7]